ncbi:hypothetical protein HF521_013159 [Silurus meridionalis]|uniref:Uncharacterized protein n=1 Tax=Silurus meridionalis TaxID=175797 RepID=A0A8T0AGQ0_SILME|nr:hypothetical protein HF521_013159 [Silurus meridionalis]
MTSSSLSAQERRTARVVFLGAAGVGKTSLIARFLHWKLDGAARLVLEILDTSGSYALPAMRALRIRTGDTFAVVYATREL